MGKICAEMEMAPLRTNGEETEWKSKYTYLCCISVYILVPCSYCAVTRGYGSDIVIYNAMH
jgi:hypothetical protein